jgi:hypothetical protein
MLYACIHKRERDRETEMQTYRMIVKTQTTENGRAKSTTEYVRHILDADLPARRETARTSAPAGATRTIKVVPEG